MVYLNQHFLIERKNLNKPIVFSIGGSLCGNKSVFVYILF